VSALGRSERARSRDDRYRSCAPRSLTAELSLEQLPQVGDDEIGAVRLEREGLAVAVDADDHRELTRSARLDAVTGGLEDDRSPGVDAELPACGEEHVRGRLPAEVLGPRGVPVDVTVDQAGEPRPLQQQVHVRGARHDGAPHPGVAEELQVQACAWVGVRAAPREQLDEGTLLAIDEPVDRLGARLVVPVAFGQCDATAGEVLVHARDGAPAVDERRVVDLHAERRERNARSLDPALVELVERGLPRLRVDGRARDEHAVDVEDAADGVRRDAEQPLRLPRRGDEPDEEPRHLPLPRKGLEQPCDGDTLVAQVTCARPELGRRKLVSRRVEGATRGFERTPPGADERVEVDGLDRHVGKCGPVCSTGELRRCPTVLRSTGESDTSHKLRVWCDGVRSSAQAAEV